MCRSPRLIQPDGMTEALRQRILAGCHYGTLKAGDRLSSLRDVAAEFYTNPRAVMAAYRRLATEGLVRIRPRSGVFVQSPRREEARQPDVVAWMVELFLRGLARGHPACRAGSPGSCVPRDRQRPCRLRGVQPRPALRAVPAGPLRLWLRRGRHRYGRARGRAPPRAIGSVDLLLTTRFHGEEAQRLGRQLRCPVLVATLDPAFITEVRRLHAAGPVWWVCTDPRFAAKLPRISRGIGEAGRPGAASSGPHPACRHGLCHAPRRGAPAAGMAWRPRRHHHARVLGGDVAVPARVPHREEAAARPGLVPAAPRALPDCNSRAAAASN